MVEDLTIPRPHSSISSILGAHTSNSTIRLSHSATLVLDLGAFDPVVGTNPYLLIFAPAKPFLLSP